jgi:uncharacterized protein (TIGR02145 family)
MIIIKTFCVGLIAVSACFALSISGKVTDTSGSPIAGASVRLEINGPTAISDVDGKFTLSTVANKDQIPQSKQCRFSVSINNGFLLVDLKEKAPVDVITYNLLGRAISTIRKSMDVGMNSLILPNCGSGIFLYKVKSGNMEFMLKSNSVNQFSKGKAVLEKDFVPYISLAKHAKVTSRINDVINVNKDGYLDYRCVMYNSDTSGIEIKMIICADTVRDIDGNLYQAVRIGNQVWTVENLRVTKYNDSTAITNIINRTAWVACSSSHTPAYCYYNNTANTDSIKIFGSMYNWYVVNPANAKKLAPLGWHVPTDSEWETLQNHLIANGYNWDSTKTGNKIAASMAAKSDWKTSTATDGIGKDLTINNRSGFSALPGGYRNDDGGFVYIGSDGDWWSVTEFNASIALFRNLYFGTVTFYRLSYPKSCGFSVRLMRD